MLVPDAIAAQESGSRRVLIDHSIFKELGRTPPPRWDLIDIRDYRAMHGPNSREQPLCGTLLAR